MHPFEVAGLGKAPFRCVGVSENVYVTAGGAHRQAGGSCDYCGTGIRWEYSIISSDQKRFVVGCDCVEKTESAVAGFKEQKAIHQKQLRDARNAIAKAAREAEQAARMAEVKKELEANRIRRRNDWNECNKELNTRLTAYAGTNEFIKHIIDNLNMWGALTERQMAVVENALATEESNKLKISAHVGGIGERIEKKCKVVFCKFLGNSSFYPFPANFLVKLQLESGESLVWFTSKGYDNGTEFNKFTVKAHTEYMGAKETTVSRVK
jgi:hypothetical protein